MPGGEAVTWDTIWRYMSYPKHRSTIMSYLIVVFNAGYLCLRNKQD